MSAHIYAFAVAGLGVLAFKIVQLPLPWLLGPIFACLIAALLGVPMRGVKVINEAMRSILGIGRRCHILSHIADLNGRYVANPFVDPGDDHLHRTPWRFLFSAFMGV
jgi:hypothetical protein